jgi:hypothetical protein
MLGAVLALATSWWIESRRRAEDDKRARRPLKIRVETEAHLVLLAMQRLVTSLSGPTLGGQEEHPGTVLTELKPLLESFDRVQDRLYLLRSPVTETALGVWYRRLRITVEQAANTGFGRVFDVEDERASYRNRFIELQGEGNRLLDQIRKLE